MTQQIEEIDILAEAPQGVRTPPPGGSFAALAAKTTTAPTALPKAPEAEEAPEKPSRRAKKAKPDATAPEATKKAKGRGKGSDDDGKKNSKRKKKVREEDLPLSERTPKPMPIMKVDLPLNKKQLAAKEKVDARQAKEADAAVLRINGSDEKIKIPKKPWLTLFSGKRARPDETAETLTDLASMLESGMSEKDAVGALAAQYHNYDVGQAYAMVNLLMDRGVTLGLAMNDQTDAFPPVVRELIAAAKMPSDMHRNLRQAAMIIMENDNIKGEVKAALFKPGFLLVFLLAFAIMAMQFIMPTIADMFTGIGAETPPLTLVAMAIGSVMKWIVLGFVALLIIAWFVWIFFLKGNPKAKAKADAWSLKAPLIGEVVKMSTAARMVDVLAACLSVGMSETEALEISGRAAGNDAVKRWMEDHVVRQHAGMVTFSAFTRTELFPWNLRNRMETTTSLTRRIEILRELGESFHKKAQTRLARFVERVGPLSESVVVIGCVGVVALVVAPMLTFIPTMIGTFE